MATATQSRRKNLTEPSKKGSSGVWLLAGHYDPEFVTASVAELDRLAQLPANWDSYGAPQIDPPIIAAVKTFIRALPADLAYRPRVVPMSTGNVQLEWHHEKKVLELEFESPQIIRYLQFDPARAVEEEDSFRSSEIDKAVDLIQWFMIGTRA
jgi:hypothetical protein